MNQARTADLVLEKQKKRIEDEGQRIRKYELDLEQKARKAEDNRIRRVLDEQNNMRLFLANQVDEKAEREKVEKFVLSEQAQIWAKDKNIQEGVEKHIKDKITIMNSENEEFLLKQI